MYARLAYSLIFKMEVVYVSEAAVHFNKLHGVTFWKVVLFSRNQTKFPSKSFMKTPVLNIIKIFQGDM
jgi:hypothetical protein